MAVYTHYERYCPKCRKYFTGKGLKCRKCGGDTRSSEWWKVEFTVEVDGIRKRKAVTGCSTKRDAESKMRAVIGKAEEMSVDPRVGDYLEEYLEYHGKRVVVSTLKGTESALRSLGPVLLKKVSKVTPKDFEDWMDSERGRGVGGNTLREKCAKVGAYLKYVSDFHSKGVALAAWRKVALPKKDPVKPRDAWTAEETVKFLNHCETETLLALGRDPELKLMKNKDLVACEALWRWLLGTGNRIGEALALRVSDLDFESNTASVEHSVSSCVTEEEKKKGKTWTLGERKNHQPLYIPVAEDLMRFMKGYVKMMKLSKSDFLFFGTKPMAKNTVSRILERQVGKAGVPKLSPHGMRHTFATQVVAMGLSAENVSVLAALLGHDPSVTMKTYVHVSEEGRKIVEELSKR